ENGAQYTLGRDRVLAHVVAVASEHAAEILRPRAIDDAVEDYVADVPGAQLLRLGWTGEEGINLAPCGELERFGQRARAGDPADVLAGVEPDMGGHRNQECVRVRPDD